MFLALEWDHPFPASYWDNWLLVAKQRIHLKYTDEMQPVYLSFVRMECLRLIKLSLSERGDRLCGMEICIKEQTHEVYEMLLIFLQSS